MCVGSYNYKGLTIYKNISQFGSPYYSLANLEIVLDDGSNPHCHATTEGIAKQIADAFYMLKTFGSAEKYKRYIRNKSMRLLNWYIKF